jgi:colicin import membrane protein
MSAAALPHRTASAPRDAEGRARGIGLSLLVHAGLVVAIAFGVRWRSHTPEAQQAELWAAVPQAAAARAVEPEPTPVAEPPRPVPPVVAPPPPKAAELPDAKIALEKARKEEQQRKEQAEQERKRRAAEAEREKAEKLRRQQEAEQQKQKAAEERAAQQREAERQKNLQRIQGLAGASGDAAARGTATQSAGPSASYAGMIVARLKRENNFIGAVAGNPKAEVEIRVGPDGTIQGRRLLKGSGVAAWDEAVLRAIDKAGALPRDVDGRVQNPTLVVWGPQD